MIVYWPSLCNWETCRQQYLWRRGCAGVDAGGGVGKMRPRPVGPEARFDDHALVGTVVQRAVEVFYNMRGWERGEQEAEQILRIVANDEFDKALRKASGPNPYWRINPRANLTDMRGDIVQSAVGFVETCHQNNLYGEVAIPEHKMAGKLRESPEVLVAGRLDLYLIRNDGEDPVIIDGKNGREYWDDDAGTVKMHVDVDQLVFYALVAFLVDGKVPKRLGVVPYRYPAGYRWDREVERLRCEVAVPDASTSRRRALSFYENREPSKGVTWHECDRDMLERMAARAIAFADELGRIEKAVVAGDPQEVAAREFPAHVTGDCRICDYESECPQRQEHLIELRARRKPQAAAVPFVSEWDQVSPGDLDGIFGLGDLIRGSQG